MAPNHGKLLSSFKLCHVDIFKEEECEKGYHIGSGSAMNVYEGKLNGRKVAIKLSIKKYDYPAVIQEINIMSNIKHPNIITFYGVVFFDTKPGLILELAEEALGSYLQKLSENETPVDPATKARFCYEIANGLQAIHEAKVVFGDLKGDNILVCKSGSQRVCKISDFGYSVTSLSVSEGNSAGFTDHFVAPEEFDNHLKLFKGLQTSDIYSYGLVVWQIVKNGEIPFEGRERSSIQKAKMKDGSFSRDLRKLYFTDNPNPNSFWEVIEAATRYMPNERSSLDDIKSMLTKEFPSIQEESVIANAQNQNEIYLNEPITHIPEERISGYRAIPVPEEFKREMFRFVLKHSKSPKCHCSIKSELATHYYYGFGVEKNIIEAVRLCKEAAELGDIPSMYNYGFFLKTIDKNDEEANKWFQKAADEGDIEANLSLGRYYTTKEQYDEAEKYFLKAIEDEKKSRVETFYGHSKKYELTDRESALSMAHILLGKFYLKRKEFAKAREFYRGALYKDDSYLHHLIGLTYEDAEEYDKAFEEFKMAVEKHKNYAEQHVVELSKIHYILIRVYEKNSKRCSEDKQYLKQIVDAGGEELQYQFANVLIRLEDEDEALEYYNKAADRGHQDAALCGGHYHYTKEKYERAEELFLKIVKHEHLKLDVSSRLGFATLWRKKLFESQCWFLRAAGVDLFDTDDDDMNVNIEELKEKAINGDHNAQVAIAKVVIVKKDKKDLKKAIKWLSKAEKIDESIALALGVFCETGLLGTRNLEKAMGFYSRSDERGKKHHEKILTIKSNTRKPLSLSRTSSSYSSTSSSSTSSCESKHAENEMVYKCMICCKGHAVLCSECFYAAEHKGHEVIAYFAPDANTNCDCGNTELPDNTLHCRHHGTGTRNRRYGISNIRSFCKIYSFSRRLRLRWNSSIFSGSFTQNIY